MQVFLEVLAKPGAQVNVVLRDPLVPLVKLDHVVSLAAPEQWVSAETKDLLGQLAVPVSEDRLVSEAIVERPGPPDS